MLLKMLLGKIDKIFCAYFGLKQGEVQPDTVQMIDDEIIVTTNTLSFKRHTMNESWDDFSTSEMSQVNLENREKLGLASGEVIAKNLVISFEETPIKSV